MIRLHGILLPLWRFRFIDFPFVPQGKPAADQASDAGDQYEPPARPVVDDAHVEQKWIQTDHKSGDASHEQNEPPLKIAIRIHGTRSIMQMPPKKKNGAG
jgi:hypothetical protein